ncbi:hypothetical protein [Amycolatopsis anabasis]|uniref:hypothetical protein n=1 Tax=Amycolatopsis anabasis TaxID=1840409 RepID=UPI00131C0C6E|nr:hypothetical protein [Amycolatopsis anabasis]
MHRTDPRVLLEDPAHLVPAVPAAAEPGGIAWLRANVARFSNGTGHARRRSLATAALARVADAAPLRAQAFARATAVVGSAGGRPIDLMAEVARTVPVEVLAEALGMTGVTGAMVAEVARAYHPGAETGIGADRAVGRLVEAAGGVADERAAALAGLLVQACDATAGLVGNAALALLRAPGIPVDEVVAETLRRDPPVRRTRREAGGTVVTVELAAGGLAFGAGSHRCPGRGHAIALACGILDVVGACELVEAEIEYEPSPNLRMPAALLVCAR